MSRATRQWILVVAVSAGSVGTLACNLVLGNLQDAVGDGGSEASTKSSSGSEGGTGSSSGSSSGSEGGTVAASQCGDSGACVLGGVFSVGERTGNAGSVTLADGGTITLTDEGFEFGGASCDTTGANCVMGAITP